MALLYWSFSLHLKSSPNSSHALVLPCIFTLTSNWVPLRSCTTITPNSFLFLKHIKLFLILGPSNLFFHVPRFLMSHFSCPKQYYSPSFYLVWLTLHSPGLGRKAVVVKSSESYPTLWDPMDCSLPGSSVHGISQQEYWSGLPFPSPGDLPNPGIEPGSPALQVDSFITESPGKLSQKSNL